MKWLVNRDLKNMNKELVVFLQQTISWYFPGVTE